MVDETDIWLLDSNSQSDISLENENSLLESLKINSSLDMSLENENDLLKSPIVSPIVSERPLSSTARLRDCALLKKKIGVASRLVKSAILTQILKTLKHNFKTLTTRLIAAEDQIDYIVEETVMKKKKKYVKKLVQTRRNGTGM